MKLRSFLPLLMLCLGMCLTVPADTARAEAQVSFSFFYDNLSPYGEWVTVGDYGSAWHPNQVDNEWSPYQDGSWAYTDDGWTWVSDEPWADVTYHYGRWVDVDGYGWCWVPGYEWAPAWVSWRSSDDYIGWAPLPPEATWEPAVGFSVWIDSYYDIGPRYYRFCRVQDFCEPNLRRVCRPWHENVAIMSVTYNITNINYRNDDRRIFVGGPHLSFLQNRTTRPVRHLRLIEEDRYQHSMVRGDEFRIFRPNVDRDRDRDRVRNSITKTFDRARIDHGWRNSGNDKERRDLRNRVQDQARGLTPQNAPAALVSRTDGGLSAREIHERHDRATGRKEGPGSQADARRGKGKGNDNDSDKTRGPGSPGPMIGNLGGRNPDNDRDGRFNDKSKGPGDTRKPNAKGDDREDIRRGLPVPSTVDRNMPGKNDRDDDNAKNKGGDPRKNSNTRGDDGRPNPGKVMREDDDRPDARKGVPVPPNLDRKPTDDSPRKMTDREKNEGTSRGPNSPKIAVPDRAPPEVKREAPDRPVMPKKPDAPRIEHREAPKIKPQPRPEVEMRKPDSTPKVERSAPPQVKREAPPQVERRAPAPTPGPKPQPSANHGGGDKKKDGKKKDD